MWTMLNDKWGSTIEREKRLLGAWCDRCLVCKQKNSHQLNIWSLHPTMDQWTFSFDTDSELGRWAIDGHLIGDRMRALKWWQFQLMAHLPRRYFSVSSYQLQLLDDEIRRRLQ
jgi:hypothetical protein